MRILLDANIVLRLGHHESPQHAETTEAIAKLTAQGAGLCIVPQVLYEYWSVATRPIANNGLGMTVPQTEAVLTRWVSLFRLLLDERGVFTHWRDLVVRHAVHGKLTHDARLVAAMQRHGLTNLLTFNKPDFARFTSISNFSPSEILAGRLPT